MKDFAVLRIKIANSESHSIEYKDTMREAETRFHNILAADEGSEATNYCLCMILDKHANVVRSEVHDYRAEPTAFYPVIRIFEKNEEMSNSVQIFEDNPATPGKAHDDAVKRWYAIIAADLADEAVTYNAAIMMDNSGMLGEHKAFERAVEPEPEPTPEPEE